MVMGLFQAFNISASGMTAESLASALGVDIKDIEMLNG